MEYIPANPVINLGACFKSGRLAVPAPGLFSVARHALLYYLDYLSSVRGRPIRNVLLPDLMCHEVVSCLRERGYTPRFYALDQDLDASPEVIKSQMSGPSDAVVITHFYGRISRHLEDIERLCARQIPLIEDCVHLPFPHFTSPANFSGDAKLYTLRKVYPVPLGAVIILDEGQGHFSRYVSSLGAPRYDKNLSAFPIWFAKQLAKKTLMATGLPYAPAYRDLSEDPLKPFNFLRPSSRILLSQENFSQAMTLRRRNYGRYLEHAAVFKKWGRFLACDGPFDVTYQFAVFLEDRLNALALVKRLMNKGVPAALGLAGDPEALKASPNCRLYGSIVALPVHQDISLAHIDYIARIFDCEAARLA